jgi:hypothetical protein
VPLIWVAHLVVSDRTAEKLRTRHHLEPAAVVAAVQCRRFLFGRRVHDHRGTRVMVQVRIGDRRVLVVLYPAGDDVWHLGSAYEIRGRRL